MRHKNFSAAEPQSKFGISPAKAQRVVISTEGRNLSQIPRPLGMTDFGPSLGVPFDTAQDMLGAMIVLFLGDLARTL
jgi:hypothetical protein